MTEEIAIAESRASVTSRFHFIMEYSVKNPSEQEEIVAELVNILKFLGSSSRVVQLSFEFYENLYPSPMKYLLRRLFAEGVDVGGVLSKSKFVGPFMAQLLFHSVGERSVHCAEYCAMVWLDRATEKSEASAKAINLPNPMDYVNDDISPPQLSPDLLDDALAQELKILDDKQRKLLLLDFRKLVTHTGTLFHSRVAVAFFIFLEFYKKQSAEESDPYAPEVCLWIETFVKLVVLSLQLNQSHQYHPEKLVTMTTPLHHVLCALLTSTSAIDFIMKSSCFENNLIENLQRLVECSSGFTEKWLSVLITEVKNKSQAV